MVGFKMFIGDVMAESRSHTIWTPGTGLPVSKNGPC